MNNKIVDLPRFDSGNKRHDAWNRLQVLNNLVHSNRRQVADLYLKSFGEKDQEEMANLLISIEQCGYNAVHKEIVKSIQ